MKTKRLIGFAFLIFFILSPFIKAQDLNVHYMIGEKPSAVTKKYGKPNHQDTSDPAMICMFYQTKTHRMIFVANTEGVYQSEANASFDSQSKAKKVLDDLISSSTANGFVSDTISVSDFQIHKSGVKVELRMNENKISRQFEISIKARKTEE
jgi:hypothetical protein